MKPPCSRQRARRFPPREWHVHRDPARPPPALASHARCTLAGSLALADSRRNARATLPPAHVGEFVGDDHAHAAALHLFQLTSAEDEKAPPALPSANTPHA